MLLLYYGSRWLFLRIYSWRVFSITYFNDNWKYYWHNLTIMIKDLQRYYFSVNTKTNYFIFRVCSIYKYLFTFDFVDGEINHLLRKTYPSHHLNKLIWSLMNVILAIVINMNCYLWLLEQMENKMHLNVSKYNNNNNNKIIHYLRTSALSLK